MPHSVARFRGCKTVGGEDIWEICEELLDKFRSGEKSNAPESWLRTRRSSEDDGLECVDYSTFLDIKMLKEVCSEEREGYWCKLEVPRINLGSRATRATTYHRRTVGDIRQTPSEDEAQGPGKRKRRGQSLPRTLYQMEYLHEDEGGTADLLRNRG